MDELKTRTRRSRSSQDAFSGRLRASFRTSPLVRCGSLFVCSRRLLTLGSRGEGTCCPHEHPYFAMAIMYVRACVLRKRIFEGCIERNHYSKAPWEIRRPQGGLQLHASSPLSGVGGDRCTQNTQILSCGSEAYVYVSRPIHILGVSPPARSAPMTILFFFETGDRETPRKTEKKI